MKSAITGRQVAAGLLTIVDMFGLCCLYAHSEDYLVFCLTKIFGIALVYMTIRVWRGLGWARAWR